MGEVVVLRCVTRLDIPVERVLDGAREHLESGLVIGWDKEGQLYIASSLADGGDMLWLLEKAKAELLKDEHYT